MTGRVECFELQYEMFITSRLRGQCLLMKVVLRLVVQRSCKRVKKPQENLGYKGVKESASASVQPTCRLMMLLQLRISSPRQSRSKKKGSLMRE